MDTESNEELSVAWLINHLKNHGSMLPEGASPASACIDLVTGGADLDQVANVLKAYGDTKMPARMVKTDGTVYILFGNDNERKSVETCRRDIKDILNTDNETGPRKRNWSNAVHIGVDGVTPKEALWNSLVSGALFDTRESVLYIFGTNYTKTCKGYPLLGSMIYTAMNVKYALEEDCSDTERLKEIFSLFDRRIPNVYFSD